MRLVALRCPACSAPLAPQEQDVLMACPGCHTAVQLDHRGVTIADLLYAAPQAGTEPDAWLPLWVFYGRVELKRRATQDRPSGEGVVQALASTLGGDQGAGAPAAVARAFWAEPRRFYLPAWEISLYTTREIGGDLLRAQPRYQAIPRPEGAVLVPARLPAEDAGKMLEFIILDLEVRREDWLANIAFTVEVGAPALWAVPAVRAGERWQLVPADGQ